MRKIQIIVACLSGIFVSHVSSAQFQKGDKVIGAGFNVSSSGQKNESASVINNKVTNTSASLAFNLGFANKEHRISGFFIEGGYSISRIKNYFLPSENYKTNGYSLSGGCFTRRYKPIGKNFFLFAEGNGSLSYSKTENTYQYSKEKGYGISAGIYPGISFQSGKRLMLELRFADFVTIGYNYNETSNIANNTKSARSSFSVGSSLGLGYLQNIGIGAKWIIPSKKLSR